MIPGAFVGNKIAVRVKSSFIIEKIECYQKRFEELRAIDEADHLVSKNYMTRVEVGSEQQTRLA